MSKLHLPLVDGPLGVSPPLGSQPSMSDTLQQTLSLLLGYFEGQRVPIKCSSSGVLRMNDAELTQFVNIVATAPNFPVAGTTNKISEVVFLAHPDNTGRIWVSHGATAAVDVGWPMDKGDVFGFSTDEYAHISALIVANGDKLIIGIVQ